MLSRAVCIDSLPDGFPCYNLFSTSKTAEACVMPLNTWDESVHSIVALGYATCLFIFKTTLPLPKFDIFHVLVLAIQHLEDSICGHHVDTHEGKTEPNNVNTFSGQIQRWVNIACTWHIWIDLDLLFVVAVGITVEAQWNQFPYCYCIVVPLSCCFYQSNIYPWVDACAKLFLCMHYSIALMAFRHYKSI